MEDELFNRNSRHTHQNLGNSRISFLHSANMGKLVPDDIVQPSRWAEYDPKKPQDFGMVIKNVPIDKNSPLSDFYVQKKDITILPEFEIRKRHRYVPESIKDTGEITMAVVHGTWGRESDFCFNDNKDNQQSYRYIKEYGSRLSTKFGKPLELISVGWSGNRSHAAREDGGKFLAEYLEHAYKGTDRFFFGHSHGNNLINAATHDESMKNNPAKLLVYFACPQSINVSI